MVIEPRSIESHGALLRAAASASRAGDRRAAIAALRSAVDLAPDDRTAHRRLAAAYAVAGDRRRARAEYDRFVARLESTGRLDVAMIERDYAAAILAPAAAPDLTAARAASGLTAEQVLALRRVGVAIVAIGATVAAMLAAGAQIFAGGGLL